MTVRKKGVFLMAPRFVVCLLSIVVICFFGAGYAYSALNSNDQSLIRTAYTNGYKDALEYAFKANQDEISKLKNNREQLKEHVLNAADSYVDKVIGLN